MRKIFQKLLKIVPLLSFFLLFSTSISQLTDFHTNQIIIRNDRVLMLNGHPFFPVGVCFELGQDAYNNELKDYGFNFIDLFTQNANLYNCFGSRNLISGDINSGSQFSTQYNNILSRYWDVNITGPIN